MGTILASSIISDIRIDTLDEDASNYRLTDLEILKMLNNAQRFVVQHVPKANVVNDAWQLAAGILQTIPTGCIELVSVDFNMGTDGITQGAPIRIIEKEELDLLKPDWPTDTASATVQLYMFNDKDPTHFYVYPPQPATGQGYVRGPCSKSPTDIATTATAISIDDIFQSPLYHHACFQIYSMETDAYAPQKALAHYNACVTEIG
ncbi:MAG TPA: hypothetical protein PLA18_16180, partial [Deltaproteobacteria bacterium]|nr:hypothetical protein [Deltaproteobacteria bacterium]